jgi:hypothetical protein
MTITIQQAAVALLRSVHAPRGAVNTFVSRDASGSFICVAVDPLYWNLISDIPETYDGYRVVAEKREPTIAFH